MEKAPVRSRETNKSQPSSELGDFANWAAEFALPIPDEIITPDKTGRAEQTPETPTSRMAVVIRAASERLAGSLDTRAETKDQRRENARNRLRSAGTSALAVGREISMASLTVATLSKEAGVTSLKFVQQKVIQLGKAAQGRYQARAAAKAERRQTNEARGGGGGKQEFTDYTDTDAYTEARAMNEQKKADQAEAAATYEGDIDPIAKKRENDSMSLSDILEQAQAARGQAQQRKAERRARRAIRREQVGSGLKKGGDFLRTKIASGAKMFGRAALRTVKRAGKAVAAGASAAAASWKS